LSAIEKATFQKGAGIGQKKKHFRKFHQLYLITDLLDRRSQ